MKWSLLLLLLSAFACQNEAKQTRAVRAAEKAAQTSNSRSAENEAERDISSQSLERALDQLEREIQSK